jgi:hypothetical protein
MQIHTGSGGSTTIAVFLLLKNLKTRKNCDLINITPVIVFPALLTIGLLGCSAQRIDLVREEVVSLEIEQSKCACFVCAHVTQKGDEVVVSGTLRRCWSCRSPLTGYVYVVAVGPDGEVVERCCQRLCPEHRSRLSPCPRESHFRARMAAMPPSGSVVRIDYARTPP